MATSHTRGDVSLLSHLHDSQWFYFWTADVADIRRLVFKQISSIPLSNNASFVVWSLRWSRTWRQIGGLKNLTSRSLFRFVEPVAFRAELNCSSDSWIPTIVFNPRTLNAYLDWAWSRREAASMDIRAKLRQLFKRMFGGNVYPLDDRDRAILLTEFKRRLLPVSICLCCVYFVLSFLHPLLIKDDKAAVWLSIIGAVSTLYFLFLALASTRFQFNANQTYLAGFSIALILCINSGMHLYLTKEAIQSTNFMLIILGLAFVVTVWSHYLSFLILKPLKVLNLMDGWSSQMILIQIKSTQHYCIVRVGRSQQWVSFGRTDGTFKWWLPTTTSL